MSNSINEKYPESELTSRIIGCCMEVHRTVGNGYLEVFYQKASAIEMNRQGIAFSREPEMDIFYKDKKYRNKAS